MRRVPFVFSALAAAILLSIVGTGHAGVPFVNLEGAGGCAFNPFAYPALTAPKEGEPGYKIGGASIGKPRIGAWYVNLNDSDIDQTTIGIADTFFERLELSYGYELVAIAGADKNTHKNNLGAKVLLIPENSFGSNAVPAVSVGAIMKKTTFSVSGNVDDSGVDYYAVATKTITQLPLPVVLSGGILSTEGRVTGILGFDNDRDEVFFANIDVLPLKNLAIGFEYKQGAKFDDFKNDDFYNIHAGWFVNPNLTLILAYVNAGDRHSTSKVGLGGGTVLSVQYEF